MDANIIISNAKARCNELAQQLPNFHPLQSVMEQLSYIEESLRDKSIDREKLKGINVGIFAVREFEARAPDFAQMLYEVEDVVALMKEGRA